MRATKSTEQGQSIVIIVVSIFLMVVMAALIVDGGNLYMNRRAAQTAADAAALAGAYEYCVNGVIYPIDTVNEYAITMNSASTADLTVTADQLEVKVSITKPTFFARIFGQKTGTVEAKAAASCFNPSGVGDIIPVAWSCHPPAEEDPDEDCLLQKIPYNVFEDLKSSGFNFKQDILDEGHGSTAATYKDDLNGLEGQGKMIYVVMDTKNFNPVTECIEEGNGGSINCDFNGDDIYEVDGDANRGWLYLDDQTGTNRLTYFMEKGPDDPIVVNTWFAGATGVRDATFASGQTYREGSIVLVPIFDAVCNDINARQGDFDTKCAPYDAATDTYIEMEGGQTYYHVVAFAPFYVSCVARSNDYCPGKAYAGIDKGTIEGYFVDGYVVSGSTGGSFDLGVYVLSLTE